ncbi:M14-type cytosolic carboxypeptidase [Corticibacterium sp. UT-5YL-CI-8]|nr:M14-type cytosolic carboxypeptidase [Tianweitania sp. UT-5YL-CI-8]
MISISSKITSGSIEVVDASDPADIRLALRKDPGGVFLGWYHFRVSGAMGQACRFSLTNAADVLAWRLANREDYDNAWQNTGAVASYDGDYWFRVPGTFDGTSFIFEHQPEHDLCFYAVWPPYGAEREHRFIALAQTSPLVKFKTIGESVEGRPIDMLTIGTQGPGKAKCWIIARQHSSETQGGYFLEGVIDRLLDETDATARALLASAVIYVVPNVNPDGSANGFTRANAKGINLNREWNGPSLEMSPEVFHVRSKMEDIGVDFCIDCHADKELRCNFIWPSENVPSWKPERRDVFTRFEQAWAAASPDYELGHAYPGGCPVEADLGMAWNWIGNRFPQALSVLLEQPFKDTTEFPTPETGWSPDRAYNFGRSFPEALRAVVGRLGANAGQ